VKQQRFKATNWLNGQSSNAVDIEETDERIIEKTEENTSFSPEGFFTPGWSGASLISKNGIQIRKILLRLWADCVHQFKGISQANRSLQELIFEQFKIYCDENQPKINKLFLEKPDFLLREISRPSSKIDPVVLDFIKVSSFKSVTLYLYKVKFLSKLSASLELELNEQNLKNPSYFFQKVFKATSQNNVEITSLQKNSYSWYRPSSNLNLKISSIVKVLETISITELMKITSFSNYLKTQKKTYPHSISHEEFGKLINELLIYFPNWIEDSRMNEDRKGLEVLSVKFSGQHVTSLSQSHWLAQNSSDPKKWSKLLFPSFDSENKKDSYVKYCHELQFLSFLISLSQTYKINPIKFIQNVYKEKGQDQSHFKQTSLFGDGSESSNETLFNRVVLNLPELPKKNPHHYLTTRIINEFSKITDDGYLLILTNQKLFVPSYQDKVKQVLQVANLEAEFNFEKLVGKGEVPEFLYIFSKKQQANKFLVEGAHDNKSSHLSFNLDGKLEQFQMLKILTQELGYIWENKKNTTPIYQKDLERDFSLKFHQSVIMDGKILENENTFQNSITHPNFYRNLAINSLTLDNFFKIESIDQKENRLSERHYLFTSSDIDEKAPYALIVHTPDYLANSIEIIHMDSLEAKKQSYGEAFYQYFSLTPISRSININVFREYFNSNIGRQIIKLTLGGAATKIKSKVKSLLVPKKFSQQNQSETTLNLPKSFDILNISEENLKNLPSKELKDRYTQLLNDLENNINQDYYFALVCLSHAKIKLQHIAGNKKKRQDLDIRDPNFLNSVRNLKLRPIYPNNEDSYVEFLSNDKLALYSEVSEIKHSSDEDGQESIAILVNNEICLNIFASKNIIQFVYQILKQFKSFKPSDVLQSLKIPSSSDLDALIDEKSTKEDVLIDFYKQTNDLINQIITKMIL